MTLGMGAHIPRYVLQGEHFATDRSDCVLMSLLGSCVAACLHDPVAQVGGMNHFLLPGHPPTGANAMRYGAGAMKTLLRDVLALGAEKDRLEVALFGGAHVMRSLPKIGPANAAFAKEFVQAHGLILRRSDLGGRLGRRLRFEPTSGLFEVHTMLPEADPARTIMNNTEVRPS